MIFFTLIFSRFCKKSRGSYQRCSVKKAVLKNFAIFTGKHLCSSLFLKKLQACNFIKKRLRLLRHVFFCEYCEIFKNMYFEKHLRTTSSVSSRVAVFQKSLALPLKQNALILDFVTQVSWFCGHRYTKDFIFHILQRSSRFGPENTCFVFSKKSSQFLFFFILFSAGIYVLKVWLKGSQNGNIFFLFLFSSGI